MSKFTSLVTKLREVFQIDRPDLDFGIYRIMNARADQITRYLEHDLREKVTASLGDGQSAQLTETREKLTEAEKNATALGMDPAMVPAVKDLRTKLADLQNNDPGHQDAVFSHLLTFFSRYYEKGDYISQRRYKGDTYAIPYSGEEVVLHWANKDQYYIKSGESFTNYSFKLPDGRRVRFQLLAADTAKDNRKDNEENRLFALIPEGYSLSKTDEEGEEITNSYDPIVESGEEKGELLIHFTYRGYPKTVKKKDKNAESLKRILAHPLVTGKWNPLHSRKPTEKQKDRTLLEYHLTTYTEKNTSDYFIHKDLGTFLRNELDFYIKNEVMHLDDVQNADTFDAIKDQLRLIQTLREIALDLIRFLAQLEDFQRKLWLKKKFVTQTDYCLTLDRIPEKLYPEIVGNEIQREEWLSLYAIAEIEGTEGDLAQEATEGYSDPLTVKFLQQNPHLVLDTAHFDEEFKAQLLDAIPNLDESLDGLVIHSENFQALSLIQERYRERVRLTFIDPPYNTGGDDFSYKDNYQHSSWLTALLKSGEKAHQMLEPSGVFSAVTDDNEASRAWELWKLLFGNHNYSSVFPWEKKKKPSFRHVNVGKIFDYVNVFLKDKGCSFPFSIEETEEGKKTPLNNAGNGITEITFPARSIRFGFDGTVEPQDMSEGNILTELLNTVEIKERTNIDAFTLRGEWRYSETTVHEELKNGELFTISKIPFRPNHIKKGGAVKKMKNALTRSHYKTETNEDATAQMENLFQRSGFKNPKPVGLLKTFVQATTYDNRSGFILDYFAGSGTTGHAVINLNREDEGKRKYILVEMGDHFDTVLRPRLKKVAYSADWKEGKPTSRNTGISHGFKYLRLESYEDVLNNLRPPESASDLLGSAMGQDYQLGYMLDVEARASLLSVADFQKPFHYQLDIATDSSGASEPRPIDLVETFNYLLGLTVEHYDRNLARGYAKITGTLPSGEKTLILWRDCEVIGYEELDELCKKWDISPRQKEYDLVYLNGDHNLPNVLQELEKDGGSTQELRLRQIEPEFLKLMFEEN